MEVVEQLQKIGCKVTDLYQEPGERKWKVIIQTPNNFTSVHIAKKIKELNFRVSLFDARCMKENVVIYFDKEPIQNNFILLSTKVEKYSTTKFNKDKVLVRFLVHTEVKYDKHIIHSHDIHTKSY